MKKILTIIFTVLSCAVMAQKPVQTLGNRFNRVEALGEFASDSAMVFPKDTIQLRPTDRAIAFKGTNLYQWDGTKWLLVGSTSTALSNGLTSTGNITLIDSTLTIGDTIRYTINGIDYIQTNPYSVAINSADSGYYRRDLIYADSLGLHKLTGEQDTAFGVAPETPLNSIVVTIVDIYGGQVVKPTPNIITPIPNLQQVTNEGNTTTNPIFINSNSTQTPLRITSDFNRSNYLYFKNNSNGNWANTGFLFKNDISDDVGNEWSGHWFRLMQGSTNSDMIKDGAIIMTNGTGGMKIVSDSGRITFNSGSPAYSYDSNSHPYKEMGAFETDGSLRLNNYKNNGDSVLSTDSAGKVVMKLATGKDSSAYSSYAQSSDTSFSLNKLNGQKDTISIKIKPDTLNLDQYLHYDSLTKTLSLKISNDPGNTFDSLKAITEYAAKKYAKNYTDSAVAAGGGGTYDSAFVAVDVRGDTLILIRKNRALASDSTKFVGGSVLNGVGYVKQSGTTTTYATSIPVTDIAGILPIANGGTGTSTPGIIAGTNVTVSGSWPNQTINSSGGGGWNTTGGNAGTNDTSTYVGTNNNTNLYLKTNGIYRVKIDSLTGLTTFRYGSGLIDSAKIEIAPAGAGGLGYPYIHAYNRAWGNDGYITFSNTAVKFGTIYNTANLNINSGAIVSSNPSVSSSFTTTSGAQNFALGALGDVFLSMNYGGIQRGGFGFASGSADMSMRINGASTVSTGTQWGKVFGATQNVIIGTSNTDIPSSLFTVNNQTNSVGTYKVSVPAPKMTTEQRDSVISGVGTAVTNGGGGSPGSGYTPGTYTNIPFTGGTGAGFHATVIVSAGGVISAVNITNAGGYYTIGDLLTTSSIPAGSGFTLYIQTLTSTVAGANVYNTTTNKTNLYDGVRWSEGAKIISASATLNFTSTAAQSSSDLTITVTGAADGDVVSLGVPNASTNTNSSFTAFVSAANTVTVRFNNYSSGSIDPASGTFNVKVFKD